MESGAGSDTFCAAGVAILQEQCISSGCHVEGSFVSSLTMTIHARSQAAIVGCAIFYKLCSFVARWVDCVTRLRLIRLPVAGVVSRANKPIKPTPKSGAAYG